MRASTRTRARVCPFLGNDFTSAQQLLETLWSYEQWKIEMHLPSDAHFVDLAEKLRRSFVDSIADSIADSALNSTIQYVSASTHYAFSCTKRYTSEKQRILHLRNKYR